MPLLLKVALLPVLLLLQQPRPLPVAGAAGADVVVAVAGSLQCRVLEDVVVAGLPPDGTQSAMEALMVMVHMLQQQVASLFAAQAAADGGLGDPQTSAPPPAAAETTRGGRWLQPAADGQPGMR